MKKKLRVIQINGFRGLCFALAVLTCLIAGFVVFPGVVAMVVWNIVATKTMLLPTLGIPQGVLLWGIMVVSYMIIKKRHFAVSFKTPTELSDEELKGFSSILSIKRIALCLKSYISSMNISFSEDSCLPSSSFFFFLFKPEYL